MQLQLEEGPHEYIEDPDIRTVWKGKHNLFHLISSFAGILADSHRAEMGSRLSAKTRVFLDGTCYVVMQRFAFGSAV